MGPSTSASGRLTAAARRAGRARAAGGVPSPAGPPRSGSGGVGELALEVSAASLFRVASIFSVIFPLSLPAIQDGLDVSPFSHVVLDGDTDGFLDPRRREGGLGLAQVVGA